MAFKNSKARKQVGSGGKRRKRLKGKGPTPKAKDRVAHVNFQANKGFKKSKPKHKSNFNQERRQASDFIL